MLDPLLNVGRCLAAFRNMVDVSATHSKFFSVAGNVLCSHGVSVLDCSSFQFILFSLRNTGLQTSTQRSAEAVHNSSAVDCLGSFGCALHAGIFLNFYSK